MFENFYDKLQPEFGEDNIQLYYTDIDSFYLCFETDNIVTDVKWLPKTKNKLFQLLMVVLDLKNLSDLWIRF